MQNSNHLLEELAINTARVLSIDGVQQANSGHPGLPLGAAAMAHVLWAHQMKYNPNNAHWANRDRFVLSAGHGCMLQYSFLHLTGYHVTIDDLKNFRQLHSKTPGHPEYGLLDGIEVTTGPLGQGFANGVGMAIAAHHLAARFNRPGYTLFNYHIYAICSDGDMMEGVTSEAASLAGHLQLGNIIYLYDDNHISIEGDTAITFDEDVALRFEAYNWHVQVLPDGNDTKALMEAIDNAKAETSRPSLIKVRTHIGFGSPNKVNTAGVHGSPLGADEVKLVKQGFGFDPEKSFQVPEAVSAFYRAAGERGVVMEYRWNEMFASYKLQFPDLAASYEQGNHGILPDKWEEQLPAFEPVKGGMATRKASGKVLNAIAAYLPGLIGGSADLSPSTDTHLDKYDSFSATNRGGRNFHFGIREHAMGAVLNGMALTKNIIPYGATFLIFSEYMRPPIRLAAIMKIRAIFVFTHDSIGLGEDGTTHQPVEQLISLRSIPNLLVIRPADANETVQAWRVAIEHKTGPVVIALTRQNLPVIDQQHFSKATGLEKGAYILAGDGADPAVILIGTGSEVSLILDAHQQLAKEGINARVVSMPCWELFEKQDAVYREKVLPKAIKKRLAVEAGSTLGWHKYVTDEGAIIGMTGFGESAPAEALFQLFGFTVENIVATAKQLIAKG